MLTVALMLLSDRKALVDSSSEYVGSTKIPLYRVFFDEVRQQPPIPASKLHDLGYIDLVGKLCHKIFDVVIKILDKA